MAQNHIVIVEDERALAANYIELLERNHFKVSHFDDLPSATNGLTHIVPDLAIIDVGLKNEADGGFELLKWLRQRHPLLPIIMLTHRSDDIDTISGFRMGANDYVSKDISLSHLIARVTSLLKFSKAIKTAPSEQTIREVGDLRINLDEFKVLWKGEDVPLHVTEIWMVDALTQYPGHVKSKDQLMKAAQTHVDDNTITTYIKRIRDHFKSIDADFDRIETVYSRGYRWKS
jgi:two-component system OmpR family response regulator